MGWMVEWREKGKKQSVPLGVYILARIIMIIFYLSMIPVSVPISVLWYVFAKSNMSNKNKWIFSIIFVIGYCILLCSICCCFGLNTMGQQS